MPKFNTLYFQFLDLKSVKSRNWKKMVLNFGNILFWFFNYTSRFCWQNMIWSDFYNFCVSETINAENKCATQRENRALSFFIYFRRRILHICLVTFRSLISSTKVHLISFHIHLHLIHFIDHFHLIHIYDIWLYSYYIVTQAHCFFQFLAKAVSGS